MPGTSEEQLTHADLAGADLTRADLAGADLTRADLAGADLAGTLAQLSENLSSVPLGEPTPSRARNLASPRECQPPTRAGLFSLLDPTCSTEYREQFRLLRTQLMLHRSRFEHDEDFRVVSVMSTQKGEGKSFTASNLAAVLAVAGDQKVLLIDSNPESRPLPIGVSLPEKAGLRHALTSPAEWSRAVYKVTGTPLYVLARGVSKSTTSLDFEPLPELLEVLRGQFEWIIVDGAAFASCPDAPWLTAVTDGTLMVVRESASSFGAVQQSLASIPQDRLVGVVFNQCKSKPKGRLRLRFRFGRKAD